MVQLGQILVPSHVACFDVIVQKDIALGGGSRWIVQNLRFKIE